MTAEDRPDIVARRRIALALVAAIGVSFVAGAALYAVPEQRRDKLAQMRRRYRAKYGPRLRPAIDEPRR